MGVFKGFLSHALHICSESYLAQEIEFLINVFAENGHSITVLEKVAKEYPAGIYLLKVNNRSTRTRCEICSKLTIKTPERRH